MRRAFLLWSVTLALGCASNPTNVDKENARAPDKAAPASKPAGEDDAHQSAVKKAQLERQLAIERAKLQRAQMDVDTLAALGSAALEKAKAELEMAEQALKYFDEVDAPLRTTRAKIGLLDAQDSVTDQGEEMQQLQLMYKEDDLADKTKEIVLRRGQRRLERAQQRLEVEKAESETVLNHDLTESRRKLQLALTEKTVALKQAERSAQSDRLDKDMAVMSAKAEVTRIEEEIAALAEKPKPAGAQP